MITLTKYARREPTTDAVLREYAPNHRAFDVVFYDDPSAKHFYARWMWHGNPPRYGTSRVTLNCFRWRVVWLPTSTEGEN